MGKGDKRTRRGKIFAGSYGKTRPRHKKKNVPVAADEPKAKKKGK
ncbi:MAG: 30S ribosomal protein THX [Pyrinomonadaceae bacterium]